MAGVRLALACCLMASAHAAVHLVRGRPALSRGASARCAPVMAALGDLGDVGDEPSAPPPQYGAWPPTISDHGRFRSPSGELQRGSLEAGGPHRRMLVNGRSFRLHRLVCTTWHGLPPTPAHTQVTHKDGNPSNNSPDNLFWDMPAEKSREPRGSRPKPSAGTKSKSVRGRKAGTEDEWRQFESCRAAARELGREFDSAAILAVASGKSARVGTDGWTFEYVADVIEGEEWRPVVVDGVESGAHVSDRGRFRDTRGVVKSAPARGGRGTQRAWDLKLNDGRTHFFFRLVCAAWHGPPPTPKYQVHHVDSDTSNNAPANLVWRQALEDAHTHDSHPVRGREAGTDDEWTNFESSSAAARKLGPGFSALRIADVGDGRSTQTGGWEFEFAEDYGIEGEVWRDVVLPPYRA